MDAPTSADDVGDAGGGGRATDRRLDGSDREAHVVVVADSDTAITDDVARLLGDSYAVRTAHGGRAVRSEVDASVSVVLLDPALPGLSVGDVFDRLAAETVDSRLAALADGPVTDDRFDDRVGKPVSAGALRRTVDRLCRCVAYRTTLEELYDLATARASLPESDPQCARLDERVADLRADLEEAASALDTTDAFEAALRDRGE